MLNIITSVNDLADKVKNFFIQNSNSPFLWLGIFIGGLVIFNIVYQALNKNE